LTGTLWRVYSFPLAAELHRHEDAAMEVLMFHSSADAIWSSRVAAYPDRFDTVDFSDDEVTLPAHVDIELSGGVLVGGFECEVDMRHEAGDWMLSGVSYCSDFGGPSDDFDAETLKASKPDGTLRDLIRREVLQLLSGQYNSLADAATIKARAA
jgi:hypothetical protein